MKQVNFSRRKYTRRRILKQGGVLGTVTVIASSIPLARGQEQDFVDPSSQLAQSLNYVENAENSEVRPDESQYCYNCQFYLASEDAENAPCQILMNQLVPREAWCSGWVQKQQQN